MEDFEARVTWNGFRQFIVVVPELDLVIEKISDFVSDSFLNNGRTKDLLLDFFRTHISYLRESKIILTEYEHQGNTASIKGVRKDKYFKIPLPPGSMLIKENGQWKLYGNQIPK